MEIDFTQVSSSHNDEEKAKIDIRREVNDQARLTVSLKNFNPRADGNQIIEGNQILKHPFLAWVERVPFSANYTIPNFPIYNGMGCPRAYLVRFLAHCRNVVRR